MKRRKSTPAAVAILLGVLSLIALIPACTYGPVQEHVWIENADEHFNTHTFAVALNWRRFRAPTGLSTFPDGGTTQVLAQAALLYVCDVDSSHARMLARIDRPKELESGFQPWVMGWGSDCFYVKLTGRRYSSRRGAVGDLNTRYYRIGLDGSCARIDGIPDSVRLGTETGTYLPGEVTYLRVSAGYDSIDVFLQPGENRKGLFVLNQARSILEPASPRRQE